MTFLVLSHPLEKLRKEFYETRKKAKSVIITIYLFCKPGIHREAGHLFECIEWAALLNCSYTNNENAKQSIITYFCKLNNSSKQNKKKQQKMAISVLVYLYIVVSKYN